MSSPATILRTSTISILALAVLAFAPGQEGECRRHIELYSPADVAAEMGVSEGYVVRNYRVNLWQRPTPEGKGRKVGEMRPGSRAVILQEGAEDYHVRSPLDGSVGWVNRVQVKRTLYQDTKTFRPCTP